MGESSDLMAVNTFLANRRSQMRRPFPRIALQVLIFDVIIYVLQLCLDVGAMELDHAMYIKGEVKKFVLSYV